MATGLLQARSLPGTSTVLVGGAEAPALRPRDRLRLLLWSGVIVLSVSLLLYPKELELEYAPVQSLGAFADLPLFVTLYYAWIAGLVAILFLQKRGEGHRWENALLVSLFVLVFRGMWDIAYPLRTPDGLANATTIKSIQELAAVPLGHPNISYTDFPGFHLLGAIIAEVSGLSLFHTAALLLVILDVGLAVLYYLIFSSLLRDSRLAAFAAVVAMHGNVIFAEFFLYPGFLGLIYIGIFLILLLRVRGEAILARPGDRFLALLVVGATAITHFVSAMVLVSLLLGIYLVRVALRRVAGSVVWSTPVLYLLLPLTWLTYWTVQTFGNIVELGSRVVANLQEQHLAYALAMGARNVGAALPLWVIATRSFWLFLLFGLGSLIVLARISRWYWLDSAQRKAGGAFLGVVMLAALNTVMSTGGFEFARFLMYAPFFTVPFLLLYLRNLKATLASALLLTAGAALFVGLSVPTFFVHYGTIRSDIYYPYETNVGQFLARIYTGAQRQPQIFSDVISTPALVHYLPDAGYRADPQGFELGGAAGLWKALEERLALFEEEGGGDKVFVLSPRPALYYRHIFDIPLDHANWTVLTDALSQHHQVYDNGHDRLFSPFVVASSVAFRP